MNSIQIDIETRVSKETFPLIPKKYRHRDHPSHPLNFTAKSWKRRGRGKKEHFSRETNATMVHPPPFQTISISHPTPVHSTPPLLCNVSTLPLSQLVSSASRLPFPRRIPRSTGLDSRAKHTDIGREGAPTGYRAGVDSEA